jgi:hypothetical protein
MHLSERELAGMRRRGGHVAAGARQVAWRRRGLRGDEGNNSALGVHTASGSGGHAVEGATALVAMQLVLSIATTQWQAGAGRSSVEACFTRQPVVA